MRRKQKGFIARLFTNPLFLWPALVLPVLAAAALSDSPVSVAIAAPADDEKDASVAPEKEVVPKAPEKPTEVAPVEPDVPGPDFFAGVTGEEATETLRLIRLMINDWKSVGWIAGVVALLNLLMHIFRLGAIGQLFAKAKIKWLKPLIALLLGGLLGGFSSLSTEAGVLNSVIAGVMAALGSVGFHELISKVRERKS